MKSVRIVGGDSFLDVVGESDGSTVVNLRSLKGVFDLKVFA